eukprot:g56492.t1
MCCQRAKWLTTFAYDSCSHDIPKSSNFELIALLFKVHDTETKNLLRQERIAISNTVRLRCLNLHGFP